MNDGLFWADFDFSSISGGDSVEFPCTGECVSQFSITWLWNVEVLLDLAFLGFGLGGGPLISTKLSANPFFGFDFTTGKMGFVKILVWGWISEKSYNVEIGYDSTSPVN